MQLVQRFANNYTNRLPAFPIAQVKNPQRSPLRLRFLQVLQYLAHSEKHSA